MNWAITGKGCSQHRACSLVGLDRKTYRYASRRPADDGILKRLRELALEPGLRLGRLDRWQAVPDPVRDRRLHPEMLGNGGV